MKAVDAAVIGWLSLNALDPPDGPVIKLSSLDFVVLECKDQPLELYLHSVGYEPHSMI